MGGSTATLPVSTSTISRQGATSSGCGATGSLRQRVPARIFTTADLVTAQQLAEGVAHLRCGLDLVVLAQNGNHVGIVHLREGGVCGFAQVAGLLTQDHDEELAGLDGLDLADRLECGAAHARVVALAVDARERIEGV